MANSNVRNVKSTDPCKTYKCIVDDIKLSLIFAFHQYLDMIHDDLIKPKTPSKTRANPDKRNTFRMFCNNGIFPLLSREKQKTVKNNFDTHINDLMGNEYAKEYGLNLFYFMKQAGLFEFNTIQKEFLLTTVNWERKLRTSYSYSPPTKNTTKNTANNTKIVHLLWDYLNGKTNNTQRIKGWARSRAFLVRNIDRNKVPQLAINMSHTRGTGAWGVELSRFSKIFTHNVGLLNSGIAFKLYHNNTYAKQIAQAQNRSNNNIFNENNQGRLVATNLLRGVQNRGNTNNTRTPAQDTTKVEFTIFGEITMSYTNIPNKTNNHWTIQYGSRATPLPGRFLSKPSVLSGLNNVNALITRNRYLLMLQKYVGDFFQCIAYNGKQKCIPINDPLKNQMVFLTGDFSCGLGYILTNDVMKNKNINILLELNGSAKNNWALPTLFYCVNTKVGDWLKFDTCNGSANYCYSKSNVPKLIPNKPTQKKNLTPSSFNNSPSNVYLNLKKKYIKALKNNKNNNSVNNALRNLRAYENKTNNINIRYGIMKIEWDKSKNRHKMVTTNNWIKRKNNLNTIIKAYYKKTRTLNTNTNNLAELNKRRTNWNSKVNKLIATRVQPARGI